jgi:hypothetical protein
MTASRSMSGVALPFPAREVVPDRALGRQVLGKCAPLAASGKQVEHGVQHLAHVHAASPATALCRTDQWRHQRPFGIRQVRRVAQPTPIRRASMFRCPCHPSPPRIVPTGRESHPIQAIQLLSGWALRVLKWLSENGLSLEVCGRLCERVTPRSASSSAVALAFIGLPRSACKVS